MKYVFRFLPVFLWLSITAAFAAQLPDFTDLAGQSGQAVVNISTVKIVKNQQRS